MLVFRDLSQVRLFVGTPVRVQFAPPLSQGLDLMFPDEEKRDWSKKKRCRCGGKEERLLSVEEETMFRPVGEVGARVQDEEPDHQRKEGQGVKDQPGDCHCHHFGETFFPALVWALHQGKRNRPADENIVQSVSSVIVAEEEESNGGIVIQTRSMLMRKYVS